MARPIWSGTILFGLVFVPVRMYSATESKELRFNFLHKERTKRQKRPADGTRKRSTTRKRKAS